MELELTEAIEEFLLNGRKDGWSPGTVDRYRWHLARFAAWCQGAGLTAVTAVTRSHLRSWGAGLRDHWAAATCKQAITAVRSFLRWCESEKIVADAGELTGVLKTPKVKRRVQRTVWRSEVEDLLAQCQVLPGHGVDHNTGAVIRIRDAAIIEFLFDTLVRNAELCSLDVADVDVDRRLVFVTGKGGARLAVRFGETCAEALRTWLSVRPACDCPALFVTVGANPGNRLKPRGLRQLLQRIAERAGVAKLSPHAFRRGGACALTERGAPSRLVQIWGRWSSLTMVEIYTGALSVGELVDAYSPVDELDVAGVHDLQQRRRRQLQEA